MSWNLTIENEEVVLDLVVENNEIVYEFTVEQDAASTALAAAARAEEAQSEAESASVSTAADRVQTGLDRVQTGLDRTATGSDRTQTGLDKTATASDRVQTGQDRVATGQDRVQTGLDRVATGQDKTASAADRVQTGLDRTATGQDRTQTGLDRTATGQDKTASAADRVQTGLDRTATVQDRTQTSADKVQTGLDRVATAADRVQTGLDAQTATTQAGIATTKANEASQSASNALASEQEATDQAIIATTQASNALISANNAASSAASAALNTPLTGFASGANTTILSTDTTLQAFGKTQGQISERIGGTVGVGQVAFGTGTKNISSSSILTWDNVNGLLGLGRVPGVQIDVVGSIRASSTFFTNAVQANLFQTSGNNFTFRGFSAVYITMFQTTGNLVLQNGGTFTDAGFRLDVNGTARVQGNLTTNLTAGSVPFIGASGLLTQDNNGLFWDNTNKRLGIGTTAPTQALHVTGQGLFNGNLSVSKSNASLVLSTGSDQYLTLLAGNGNTQKITATYNLELASVADNIFINPFKNVGIGTIAPTAKLHITAQGSLSTDIVFRIRNSANTLDIIGVNGTGNILINTTTDAGFRLDVNGTARVQGVLTVSTGGADITTGGATTFIRRSSSAHLGIGIAVDGAADFRINGATKFYIGALATNSLEIPHTLRIAFVNPGIATFSNILWDNTNTEFRLVNGNNTDTVNLRTSRFICSNISNTFNSSAQLQVDSTSRGFLPPRMTSVQRDAIAIPATGLMVYNTTDNRPSFYNGTSWINL